MGRVFDTNQTVGEYRIVDFLGVGGMGEVYRAMHSKIGRVAAVKVLTQATQASGFVQRFLNEAVELVKKYGGVASGEHGDGQARAQFWEQMFGPELVQAFREFKRIWDPDNRMNTGKLVNLEGTAFGVTLPMASSIQPAPFVSLGMKSVGARPPATPLSFWTTFQVLSANSINNASSEAGWAWPPVAPMT